jgi:DNA-binding response OmpR family regulator
MPKVSIVDDAEDIQILLTSCLNMHGFTVDSAARMKDAEKILPIIANLITRFYLN